MFTAIYQSTRITLAASCLVVAMLSSCSKTANQPDAATLVTVGENIGSASVESNPVQAYSGLGAVTRWELQQARAATARYSSDTINAVKDGYVNINVVSKNMGTHFLKPAYLDNVFDFRKPEILVYNKMHDGKMKLVAVEYAVPIELTPDNAPAGFTGDGDRWDRNLGFGLWLLHAWVWYPNPMGVFHPTNPDVHVD